MLALTSFPPPSPQTLHYSTARQHGHSWLVHQGGLAARAKFRRTVARGNYANCCSNASFLFWSLLKSLIYSCLWFLLACCPAASLRAYMVMAPSGRSPRAALCCRYYVSLCGSLWFLSAPLTQGCLVRELILLFIVPISMPPGWASMQARAAIYGPPPSVAPGRPVCELI